MSYLVSSWEVSTKNKEDIRRATQESMIARAIHCGVASTRNELLVVALMPEDLGLDKWQTPVETTGYPVKWIDCETPSGKILAIYKVIQLSVAPKVTKLDFYQGFSGVTCFARFQIEQVNSLLPVLKQIGRFQTKKYIRRLFERPDQMVMEAYITEPIILSPKTFTQVKVSSPGGNETGDKLMLGGFVVERIGHTIV